MSPERAAGAVSRWVALYTAGLPAPVAHRRREELDADLADHIAHARAHGAPDARIARQLAARMLRGAVADVSWRAHARRAARTHDNEEESMTSATTTSVLRVGAFVLAVLAIPFTATVLSDEAAWGVFDFVLAGVLLAVVGACFEAAWRRRGSLLVGATVAVLGIAAAGIGEVDDAPGLVLLGGLLVAGGGAIAVRRVQLR